MKSIYILLLIALTTVTGCVIRDENRRAPDGMGLILTTKPDSSPYIQNNHIIQTVNGNPVSDNLLDHVYEIILMPGKHTIGTYCFTSYPGSKITTGSKLDDAVINVAAGHVYKIRECDHRVLDLTDRMNRKKNSELTEQEMLLLKLVEKQGKPNKYKLLENTEADNIIYIDNLIYFELLDYDANHLGIFLWVTEKGRIFLENKGITR